LDRIAVEGAGRLLVYNGPPKLTSHNPKMEPSEAGVAAKEKETI
jgi:hypothetical protein